MDKKDNLNKLKNVISSIEKSYGKGSIMMLGKRSEDIDKFDVYSSGLKDFSRSSQQPL